jgi:hypothetical protein
LEYQTQKGENMKLGLQAIESSNIVRPARRILLPKKFLNGDVGLGDLIKRVTQALGIQPCQPCKRRAEQLNQILVFSAESDNNMRESRHHALFLILRKLFSWISRISPFAANSSDPCWRYYGNCTRFALYYMGTQCVTGPARQEASAETIEQCCTGWFQYPWIEVCPGEEARRGCGFCIF